MSVIILNRSSEKKTIFVKLIVLFWITYGIKIRPKL